MAYISLFDSIPIDDPAEKRRKEAAEYHIKNRDRILERKRKYEAENKLKRQLAKIKYRYGITEEDIDAMFIRQNGKCGICQKFIKRSGNKDESINIDHDHVTNIVRGLLCRSCNTLLGYARDDIKVLQNAVNYLEQAMRESLKPRTCNQKAHQKRKAAK